jgi:hypothetical protein
MIAPDTSKKRVRKTLAEVVVLRGETNIRGASSIVSKRLAAVRKMPASTFALTSG